MSGTETSAAVPVTIVAAVARNGVIGRGGTMPWHLPSDLKRFRARTIGKPLIMGRKTYESIGRPLDGRTTILVTRSTPAVPEGVFVATSVPAGIARARAIAEAGGASEICIVGGGEIYQAALPFADRLEIAWVDLTPDGDVLFPAIDPAIWIEESCVAAERGPRDDASASIATYVRRLARALDAPQA